MPAKKWVIVATIAGPQSRDFKRWVAKKSREKYFKKMIDLVVREATPSDYENLCKLFDEVDKLHREHLSKWFQKPEGPVRDKAFIHNLLTDQAVVLFVAESDDKLLGLVQAAVKASPPMSIFIPRRYVVVDTLIVTAGFREQGIGQRLMDEVHHWAKTKGASDIELNVYEFNREANTFYAKQGYETISRRLSKSLR